MLQQILAQNAYTVYLIHLPVVIAVQFSIANFRFDPLLKSIAVTVVSIPICFILSHYLRKLPAASKFLVGRDISLTPPCASLCHPCLSVMFLASRDLGSG
ncbi:acyltransferase family protein [Phormidium tenue FACHB-886]|nr:acyltransferase family protein [Phormidium tenue FACHB-886]